MVKQKVFTIILLCLSAQFIGNNYAFSYSYSGEHWKTNSIPVKFYVNTSGYTGNQTGALNSIKNAMGAWNNVASSYFMVECGNSGCTTSYTSDIYDSKNVFAWKDLSNDPVHSETVAIASIWKTSGTNIILETDVTFNAAFQWSHSGEAGKYDIQSVATHELGHTLSLNDLSGSIHSEKTMYEYVIEGEIKKRDLHQDDINGIVNIYGNCTGYGDVNGDNRLTPQDALIVFRSYLGSVSLTSCKQGIADVNGSGNITPADALCIFKKYLGLSSCLDEWW